MALLISISLLIVGLLLLVKGADWLVDGASDTAAHLKVPPIYVGLTVVAFGTSLPELIVSLIAVLTGRPGISIGNIVGSNIANIGLIIGIAALICNLAVKRRTLQYEFPIMVIISFFLMVLGNKNYVQGVNEFYFGRIDGLIFLTLFIIFLYYIYESIKKGDGKKKSELKSKYKAKNAIWKNIVFLILGSAMLFYGGKLFVDSSSEIARIFGVSEVLIGLTIVSIGTSLPELFTSVVAVLKKKVDIAVGNVVGSNIFNIAWVLGLVSFIKNITVEPVVIYLDAVIMILFALVFWFFAARMKEIKKWHGGVLLAMYASYIVFLFIRG
jgi:cation:H+ antiporter